MRRTTFAVFLGGAVGIALNLAYFSPMVGGNPVAVATPITSASPVAGSPCAVTVPNGSTPPGERPSPLHHGNDALWTVLWPNGDVRITPDSSERDGALGMKLPWWRGVPGRLTIEGRRLDAPAPPLSSDIPDGYGETGFQASGIIFPSEGCWEITGRVDGASLIFVVRVVRGDGSGTPIATPAAA